MDRKYKYGIAGVAVLGAFALGRYTVPEKVRIETKTVEVEKKTTDKTTDIKKEKRKKTTITTITHPDGTKETSTVITDDVDIDIGKKEKDTADSSTTTD